MIGEEFIVRDATGLTKFKKGDCVMVTDILDNDEVKVYKTDGRGEVILNENGNKVKYTLSIGRLKTATPNTRVMETAGVIEKRVIEKTFTDKALDTAADLVTKTNAFINDISRIKVKLSKVSSNVMKKAGEISDSADEYDAEAFAVATADLKKIVDFLKDDDTAKAISKFAKTIAPISESNFDPSSLLD